MNVMRCSGRFLSVGAVRYARRLKLGGDVWFLLMLPFVVRSRGRIYVARSSPNSDFTHHRASRTCRALARDLRGEA